MELLEHRFLYLSILLFALAYPLLQSFERRLQYWKNWKFLFPATGTMMLIFIPWDIVFTRQGVWWFNEAYFCGITFISLPLEEWAFFLVVPFACVFLYEVLNYFFPKLIFPTLSRYLALSSGLAFLMLGGIYFLQSYTFWTCIGSGTLLILTYVLNPIWLSAFWRMYAVSWLPFLAVNGALTGWFTQAATVNYNPLEIIGSRIGTIPVEDSIYSLFMLLLVIHVYEYLRK